MLSMEVPLAVLADAANVSREGKLNIFGIFGRIIASNFPSLHPQMQLVLTFEAESVEGGQEKKIEVRLMDGDGNMVLAITGTLKVPKAKNPAYPIVINHIFPLPGVPFPKAGDYAFKILVNGETKKTVPLLVAQRLSQGEG